MKYDMDLYCILVLARWHCLCLRDRLGARRGTFRLSIWPFPLGYLIAPQAKEPKWGFLQTTKNIHSFYTFMHSALLAGSWNQYFICYLACKSAPSNWAQKLFRSLRINVNSDPVSWKYLRMLLSPMFWSKWLYVPFGEGLAMCHGILPPGTQPVLSNGSDLQPRQRMAIFLLWWLLSLLKIQAWFLLIV